MSREITDTDIQVSMADQPRETDEQAFTDYIFYRQQ